MDEQSNEQQIWLGSTRKCWLARCASWQLVCNQDKLLLCVGLCAACISVKYVVVQLIIVQKHCDRAILFRTVILCVLTQWRLANWFVETVRGSMLQLQPRWQWLLGRTRVHVFAKFVAVCLWLGVVKQWIMSMCSVHVAYIKHRPRQKQCLVETQCLVCHDRSQQQQRAQKQFNLHYFVAGRVYAAQMQVWRVTTCLGAFGGPSLKPLWVYSSCDEVGRLFTSDTQARARLPEEVAVLKLFLLSSR